MSQLRKVTSFILVSSVLAVKASHPAKPQNPKEEKVKRTASSFCALLLRVLFGSINGHVLCQIIALLLSFSAFSLHKVHVQSYSEHRARKRPQRGQSSLVILLHCCQWMDTDTEVCGRFASYQPITAPEQQKGGSSAVIDNRLQRALLVGRCLMDQLWPEPETPRRLAGVVILGYFHRT